MTTFYCDYEGGNDAADGLTFANRWKTLTLGATAARIAPGDTIRMMASPDPTSLGQMATWTDGPLPATFIPTSSTNATPIVFTKVGHELVTGDTVIVANHTINTNANGVWEVTVSGDDFTLLNADGSNSVGNGVGGDTGTVRKITNSVVKLATAVTQNIAIYGNKNVSVGSNIGGVGGTTKWVSIDDGTLITFVASSLYKEGGEALQVRIKEPFTTGLIGYSTIPTLDLSAYQQVSFWIQQQIGTLGTGANAGWYIALCSDTVGTVVVDTIPIPVLGALGRISPITVDLGHALGSAIQSVALYSTVDNGAQTWYLSNIIACKASSAADSLSLTSLIGKNTGTEGWYGIQSINGTRVILDMDTNCIPAATPSRGYSGTTETVTTWKQETIKTDMAASFSTSVQSLQDSGVEGNPIIFSGGWNRTDMSTLAGETVFDGQNGNGIAVVIATKAYVTLDNLSFCRYYDAINPTNATQGCTFTGKFITNNSDVGINVGTGFRNSTITFDNITNNLYSGVMLLGNSADVSGNTFNITNINNNGVNNNIYLLNGCSNNNFNITNLKNSASYGIKLGRIFGNKLKVANSAGNSSGSISSDSGINYLLNSALNDTIKVAGLQAFANAFIWSTNENGNTDTHFGYTDGGLISSDVTTVHTAGGMSWKLSPTSTDRSASYPLPLKVAVGATAANTPITCKVWFRRDNIGLTARLICKGGQLTGIDNDVSTLMTAAADTWEEVSVTVTPTQKGVLEFHAECYGGTTYNLWTDDVSFS